MCWPASRTARVRPLFVLRHLLLFLLAVVTLVVLGSRSLRPLCGEDGRRLSLRLQQLHAAHAERYFLLFCHVLARCLFACTAFWVGMPVALFSWHMVFAELLRFRDRSFKKVGPVVTSKISTGTYEH